MRGLKPAGEPNVIGMVVGQKNPADSLASERTVEDVGPELPGFPGADASVDDGPTRAVIQRIDVHMVERLGGHGPFLPVHVRYRSLSGRF